MKVILLSTFLVFTLLSCKHAGNRSETEREIVDSILKTHPIVEEVDISPCFRVKFENFIKNFQIDKSEKDEISRNGTFECFLKNNQSNFNNLEKEIFYKISNHEEYKEAVLVKQLIFSDETNAETIFQEYTKGFHDNCIGLKEPNFILRENKTVYVFFVRAEYYRNMLMGFKKKLLSDISSCEDIEIGECR